MAGLDAVGAAARDEWWGQERDIRFAASPDLLNELLEALFKRGKPFRASPRVVQSENGENEVGPMPGDIPVESSERGAQIVAANPRVDGAEGGGREHPFQRSLEMPMKDNVRGEPAEFVTKSSSSHPALFTSDPLHHFPGLNI